MEKDNHLNVIGLTLTKENELPLAAELIKNYCPLLDGIINGYLQEIVFRDYFSEYVLTEIKKNTSEIKRYLNYLKVDSLYPRHLTIYDNKSPRQPDLLTDAVTGNKYLISPVIKRQSDNKWYITGKLIINIRGNNTPFRYMATNTEAVLTKDSKLNNNCETRSDCNQS